MVSNILTPLLILLIKSLKRVRIMNIKLDVPTGKYREFTKEELIELNRLLENSAKTYF